MIKKNSFLLSAVIKRVMLCHSPRFSVFLWALNLICSRHISQFSAIENWDECLRRPKHGEGESLGGRRQPCGQNPAGRPTVSWVVPLSNRSLSRCRTPCWTVNTPWSPVKHPVCQCLSVSVSDRLEAFPSYILESHNVQPPLPQFSWIV